MEPSREITSLPQVSPLNPLKRQEPKRDAESNDSESDRQDERGPASEPSRLTHQDAGHPEDNEPGRQLDLDA